MMKSLTFVRVLVLCAPMVFAAGAAHAQSADTLAAADRLLAVQDLKGVTTDMAKKVSAGLPVEQQQAYIDGMTAPAFLAQLNEAARQSMAKHFTVEELDALAEFYAKPIAKSAMAKMGDYMTDLMPLIQSQIMTMMQKQQPKP
jgi:hypothetical protein